MPVCRDHVHTQRAAHNKSNTPASFGSSPKNNAHITTIPAASTDRMKPNEIGCTSRRFIVISPCDPFSIDRVIGRSPPHPAGGFLALRGARTGPRQDEARRVPQPVLVPLSGLKWASLPRHRHTGQRPSPARRRAHMMIRIGSDPRADPRHALCVTCPDPECDHSDSLYCLCHSIAFVTAPITASSGVPNS
jgi:hypothetical protein